MNSTIYICRNKFIFMSNKPTIIQPNAITSARYDYSVTEKKVIYRIISHIQDSMKKGIDETLFGDLVLFIPMQELVSSSNYNRVKEDLKTLRKKSFEIIAPEQIDKSGKGEHGYLDVGFVNWTEYNKNTGMVEFEVSRRIMPYLIELAKGFTYYSLQVALSLKSVYSQRIYECCCRFRGYGVWNISIEDFKIMLKIEKEKAYVGKDANGNIKKRIIKVAEKEIKSLYDKGESDLYFVYEFKKTGKVFTDITFKIFSTKNKKHEPQKEESREYVFNFFKDHFREEHEKPFVKKAMNGLFNKNAFNIFASKISGKLEQFYDLKIEKDDLKRLTRHILKEDFQIQ